MRNWVPKCSFQIIVEKKLKLSYSSKLKLSSESDFLPPDWDFCSGDPKSSFSDSRLEVLWFSPETLRLIFEFGVELFLLAWISLSDSEILSILFSDFSSSLPLVDEPLWNLYFIEKCNETKAQMCTHYTVPLNYIKAVFFPWGRVYKIAVSPKNL